MRTQSFGARTVRYAVLPVGAFLVIYGIGLAADSGRPVTFSKDVAPILQQKCQACHQPNSIAPMSLITYQDARPWARSIKERVSSRQMPPMPMFESSPARGANSAIVVTAAMRSRWSLIGVHPSSSALASSMKLA